MQPGEYECELEQRDCRSALRFARELWSRQFVLKHVAPGVLARSAVHAALHRGHVVVRIDGVCVQGLSMRRFTELWVPDTSAASSSTATRTVRFCDRRRAELETALLHAITPALRKDLALAPHTRATVNTSAPPATHVTSTIAARIAACNSLIWRHRLRAAERELHVLLVVKQVAHPQILVMRLELALIRVLISNDALVVKHARQLAKQTLVWLHALSELPSLSLASALEMRAAVAETLLLSTAFQFIADKTVQGIAELRRCATVYATLKSQLDLTSCINDNSSKDDTKAILPNNLHVSLQSRLCFGLGMLQLASATALQGPDWLSATVRSSAGVSIDPTQALDNLLFACGSGQTTTNPRAAWASLALFHCASVVRSVQQCDPTSKVVCKIAAAQQTALKQFPHSVLHLWSASQRDASSATQLELMDRAVALAADDDSDDPIIAHVLRFDAGTRRFLALDFDASTPLFIAICKCATAPTKLRGLCSVFLAASDLLDAGAVATTDQTQRMASVRLLLRAALRYLDAVETRDAEAVCLAQRVQTFLTGADWLLYLLPIEILYVFCSSSMRRSIVSEATGTATAAAVPQHWTRCHARALAYLDRFVLPTGASVAAMGLLQSKGKVIKLNCSIHNNRRQLQQHKRFSVEAQAICEWTVLRASVLLQMGDVPRAQQQLATLEALLPQVPARSFVVALATLYELQIDLQQRLMHRGICKSSDSNKTLVIPAKTTSQHDVTRRALQLVTDVSFEYHHLLGSRLRALLAVHAKLIASGKDT